MARLVKRFRDKPYELAVGGETLYICGCGLSANLPFCDGTHKSARGEEADRLYWYDEEGKRHPDAFRAVFVLRAVEELSVEETAAALGIPEATVRTRFFRAKSLLREALSRDIDLAHGDAFSFAGARCDRIVASVIARLKDLQARDA
jgi:CDGSH-type Zn-finger protein